MKKTYISPQLYVHFIKCGTILAGSLNYTDTEAAAGYMESRGGSFSDWEEEW